MKIFNSIRIFAFLFLSPEFRKHEQEKKGKKRSITTNKYEHSVTVVFKMKKKERKNNLDYVI